MGKEDIAILKRNLRYGNYFRCLPVRWDSAIGRIVVKSPRQQRYVIAMLFVHFMATLCRLYSITLHPTKLISRSEAAFGAMVYAVTFFIRFDIPADPAAVQVMNFMLTSTIAGISKFMCLYG